jgi:UDPglucose 6-dehydrogenase
VYVYDPKVTRAAMIEEMEVSAGVTAANTKGLDESLVTSRDAYEACNGAHAVAILTEWDAFKTLDWRRIHASMMKPSFIFDGRNVLDHQALRDIGFNVYSIGAPLREL